jgi:hypothetical protein
MADNGRRAEDFTYCPDCGRKGVTWRPGGLPGEDHLKCRYCGWWTFTVDEFECDRVQQERHARAQPR